ncbi:MAG: ATP-binding protein [Alphaproteobacteria bacterium]|nr:ATP-binding protein [Alphaproteobacteria bacterium]
MEISSLVRDGMIQVTMSDTDIGIPIEKAEKAFALEQRASTRSTSVETGSGLGLPLCTSMVDKDGGLIWCESEPGNGSGFHFILPVQREAA